MFQPLLRKSVIVFCDDILVYIRDIFEHWQHLIEVFTLMTKHSMYAKLSKCSFMTKKVEYLGLGNGVESNPRKKAAVSSWPSSSTSIKEVCARLSMS